MASHRTFFRRRRFDARLLTLAAALATLVAAGPARADERGELETLRATTLGLIQALVDQGLLSRERADRLLKQAQSGAAAGGSNPSATANAAPKPPGWGDAPAPGASTTVRVPYLSETARAQITEDIKLGVLSTAREENWADARKLPPWLRTFNFEGDLRVRAEGDIFDANNLPAEFYRAQTDTPAWSPDLTNTQTSRQRLTLRARFGFTAKVSDDLSGGFRIATGGLTNPTSTSQTLGSDFNRYAIALDRAWLRWEPRYDLVLDAGRMPNPFFGSDLLWPDDIAFDGVALRAERGLGSGLTAFATAGAFPLEEFAVQRSDKWLYGLQVGADWSVDAATQLKVGLALYDFSGIQGTREANPAPTGPLAGTVPYQLSQYPASARQRGNTLINLNDPSNTGAPVWGLASRFRPINLTAALTLRQFDPFQIGIGVDFVKNSAFDLDDIRRRAGTSAVDDLSNKTSGLQVRFGGGAAQLNQRGQWNTFIAYRQFERDSWLDAFTDTTWALGGTNYKGFSVGGAYAFERNTSVGLRWTSTRNLDDGRRFLANPNDPTSISGNLSSAPLKIDVIQLEVNSRF